MKSTPDHAARGHSRWSASASARNFACPGALALIEASGVEDRESEAAAWGTVCHQIAERCLRSGADAAAYIGETVKTENFTFRFDDEMAECTQVFLDYVRGRLEEYRADIRCGKEDQWADNATLLVEQYFDLSTPLGLPIEAGGTGDAVLLFPAWNMVEVVDLKTGKKWVDAEGNPQTRHYGLGAALSNKGGWSKIRTTIVQPRVGDDCVRSEDFGVDELFDWTQDLKAAVDLTSQALDGLKLKADGSWTYLSVWEDVFLRPGEHCHSTWCPVRATCPALQQKAMERARVFFQPVTEEDRALAVTVPPDPASLDTERLVAVLDAADMIESWLNAVRAHAHNKVERGEKVGDYVLVAKRARRKWKGGVDEHAVINAVVNEGLALDDLLTEPALKSPAQVDALLKTKERKALIADLWTAESIGTNLVRADKTKRGQVPDRARRFFEPIKE